MLGAMAEISANATRMSGKGESLQLPWCAGLQVPTLSNPLRPVRASPHSEAALLSACSQVVQMLVS